MLELRGEVTKDENKQLRPKFAQVSRTYGFRKINKQFFKHHVFDQLLTQPIHHIMESSKFLTNLLHYNLKIQLKIDLKSLT